MTTAATIYDFDAYLCQKLEPKFGRLGLIARHKLLYAVHRMAICKTGEPAFKCKVLALPEGPMFVDDNDVVLFSNEYRPRRRPLLRTVRLRKAKALIRLRLKQHHITKKESELLCWLADRDFSPRTRKPRKEQHAAM